MLQGGRCLAKQLPPLLRFNFFYLYMISPRRVLKIFSICICVVLILLALPIIAVYLPPVQRWAVERVSASLEESMGLTIKMDDVRLTPFLNLNVQGMMAQDAQRDTVLSAEQLHLDVAFWPLLDGRADVEGFSLQGARINSKTIVPNLAVKGSIKSFVAEAKGADWEHSLFTLNRAHLDGAELSVALADTAQKDTTSQPVVWVVDAQDIQIQRSKILLTMPGDSLHLAASLQVARMTKGHFDLGKKDFRVKSLVLSQGAASMNMTRHLLPKDALFELSGIDCKASNINYDAAGRFMANLEHLSLREGQHDFNLTHLGGKIEGDTTWVSLPNLRVVTPNSQLKASLTADFSAFQSTGKGRFSLKGQTSIGMVDVLAVLKPHVSATQYRQMAEMSWKLMGGNPIEVQVTAEGNMRHLAVQRASLGVSGLAQVALDGFVRNAMDKGRSGTFNFSFRSQSSQHIRPLLPHDLAQTFQLPDGLAALGHLQFDGTDYRTNVTLQHAQGQIFTRARLNTETERYDVEVDVNKFPLHHFLKEQPITPFTGSFGFHGQGFSPLAVRTNLQASANIRSLRYDRYPLDGIQLKAALRGTHALVSFSAKNPLIEGRGSIDAHLNHRYMAAVDVQLDKLDLRRLTGMPDTLTFGGSFKGNVEASTDMKRMKAKGAMRQLRLIAPKRAILARDIDFAFHTKPDSTTLQAFSGDMLLDFAARGSLEQIGKKGGELAQIVQKQLKHRSIDQIYLRKRLPNMALHIVGGNNNIVSNLLRYLHYEVSTFKLHLDANAHEGINGHMAVGALKHGALVIDTIYGRLQHVDDRLHFAATVHNDKRKNPNPFTATFESSLLSHGVKAELAFTDANNKKGLQVGAEVEMEDGGTRIHLTPEKAIVAYREFTINPENFVFWGDDRRLRANVNLLADDGTSLSLHGEEADSTYKNNISVVVNHLNLGELASVVPYLPPISGELNADFHIVEQNNQFAAVGTAEAKKFGYQGVVMGDLGGELSYQPTEDGNHHAETFVTFNGKEIAEAVGTYFAKDEGSFAGKVKLKSLPMNMMDAFLEGTQTKMKGALNGELAVQGTADKPVVNGSLSFDKAHIYSNVYGVDLTMDTTTVSIHNSVLELKDFALTAVDGSPLKMSGIINMERPDAMFLNLDMIAKKFPIIDTKRNRESLVYGKVLTNFAANINGTPDKLNVRGLLTVLDKTDVTYLLSNSPISSSGELSDLVTFTDFSDTLVVEKAVAQQNSSSLNVALTIRLRQGARYKCFLTPNGDSYVDVSGEGNLELRMPPQGDMRLTGRLTLNEGKMNYELPVIPLRTFTLAPGSYVDFTGEMMNPTLNITATERVKSIVTENDHQRAVTFDAGVKISRTLEDMGLEFIIDAPEDLTIKNQLASMSPEERGKAAVALLATGMYISDDNLSTGGFKASNALNAFLQSEIQNIAGKALSTIDLSFGMENGVNATGGATTDYSFQFSKRFLNNRMRVVIGGKVSSGADQATTAESVIDNISLEYRLDANSTRYIRLFYDRGSRDPLEGQLTKTGLGVVMRRKSNNLLDLFRFNSRKTPTTPKPQTSSAQ